MNEWVILFVLNCGPGHRALFLSQTWGRGSGSNRLATSQRSGSSNTSLNLTNNYRKYSGQRQFCEEADYYNFQLQAVREEACSWSPRSNWLWFQILVRVLSVLPLKIYPRDNLVRGATICGTLSRLNRSFSLVRGRAPSWGWKFSLRADGPASSEHCPYCTIATDFPWTVVLVRKDQSQQWVRKHDFCHLKVLRGNFAEDMQRKLEI